VPYLKKKSALPLTVSDQDGNRIEGQLYIGLPKGRQLKNWTRLFEQGLLRVCKANMSGLECSMLFFLLAQSDFNNVTVCDRSLFRAYCGVEYKNQKKLVDRLLKEGFITAHQKINSLQTYKLNPLLSWKGNSNNYPSQVTLIEEVPDNWFTPEVTAS
jgi:hypothetical protein